MEVEEASRRLSGVNISGTALKERQSNNGEDEESLSEEDQERFNKYIQHAKKLVGEGNVEDALRYNKKALKICHKEKLAKKIKKMEEYLKANEEESSEDNNGMMHLGNGFYLYQELHDKLYAHQKAGVLWMWSLFKKKKGGILGDDMGLGKTIQVIGFLSGLFDMDKIKSVLIVLPVAVMVNWENEFNKWAPGLKVEAFHGNSKREKERALAKVQRRGGICLTTYGLVVTSWEQLGQKDGREFTWDYMILDEGHKIKNPTKTSKGVHAIPAKNRIILTGTPVQNNLKELWALFDFVHQGSLLGTQRTFKMEYDNPITRAREKDATVGEKRLGMEMAESLKRIIAPYFLRRTKAEVQDQEDKENEDPSKAVEPEPCAKMPTMTRKNDLIVWLFMSETQLKIYKDFLELDSVKELLMTKKSPLVALTVLKKICDHPRLLSTRACAQLGVDGDEGLDDELLETEAAELSAATRIQHIADDVLVKESGKLVFLVKLLDQLKEEGHRCLVFSQSRKILDIMQKVLTNKGHKVMRLDGTISQVYEREQRISKFQTDNSYSVFLLTTQVGGVGLTLTAADRVVIFDPSWNPATDAQAVDRAFRIGQNKNVVIYRLITCGTVEEKIYRRQIFKDSITRQTTGNAKNPYSLIGPLTVELAALEHLKYPYRFTVSLRYFSKYELRELFTLDDPHSSTTQQQLEQMHSGHRLTDPSLDSHIAFLYSLDMFGLSDHDLMFSQGAAAGDDQDVEDSAPCPENDYIQHRVEKARQLIQMESSQEITLDQRLGKMPKPDMSYPDNRNQFEGWNIPKPLQQERKSDEVPMPVKFCPIKGYSDEIDLTESPRRPGTMTTEDDAVDLTSGDEEPDVKPVIKAEKIDGYGDTNKPEVKIEHNDFQAVRIKSENESNNLSDEDVLMDTPKPTKAAVNLDNELNMSIEESNHHPLRQFDDNGMNMSVDEGNEQKVTTPKVKRTPKLTNVQTTPLKDNDKIVTEGLFISPDSSRPIIETAPKSFMPNNPDIASRLNSTILSNLSDTPDIDARSKSSVSSSGSNSPGRIYKTFIEDSPAERMNQSTKDKRLVIQDSPEKSPDSEDDDRDLEQSIKMNASLLADSILEESMVQENLEQSIADENKEKRHSVSNLLNRSKRHIANSGERDISSHIQEEDDALPDLDSGERDISSHIQEDDALPDLDSPILARPGIKSKSFKQHVIESSDENSDEDNNGATSDNVNNDSDIEMEHNGSKEQNVTGFINDEAETVSDSEPQGEVNEDLEASDHSGAEYSEEESGAEESSEEEEGNGLPDFHSLSVEDQEKYNSLVETGRAYCQQKEFEMAQACVLQALEIYPDPELQTTALKIYQKIVKYKVLKEQRIV